MKHSNPFLKPLLNLNFFLHHFNVSSFIFDHWMDKIILMGGGEKLYHGKLHDTLENHREKYFEEFFYVKHLLDFFSMIAMYQNLSNGHENFLGGMRFSDGCDMVRGRGANNFRRQPVAKYLRGVHRGIRFIQIFNSSFLSNILFLLSN